MRNRDLLLLLAGVALTALAHVRAPLAVLAWVAPVPFLMLLRSRSGWRARAVVVLALLVAWSLALGKILTEPMPAALALAFGVPIGLLRAPAFLLWDALVRRQRPLLAVAAYGVASALAEWVQVEYTSLASWGAAGYSQVGNLGLLQFAAVAGLPGLGLLIHATGAGIEGWLAGQVRPRLALAWGLALVAVQGLGEWRLLTPPPGPEVRVAAIATPARFRGLPLPSAEERSAILATLEARTREAARAGARLAVWTEAGALVLPGEEPALVERLSGLARELSLEVVAGYVVPVSEAPLRYENKYQWLGPDGSVRQVYLKHRPVPGEPAVPGPAPGAVLDLGWARTAGALCYDYDFPALARAHGRAGAGLIALPSSDWLGIDPHHTDMASVRAIEQGFSVLRSTRFGLSAAIDPLGRSRARLSANESSDPLMLASLPVRQVPTIYRRLGDAPFLALGAAVLGWSGLVLAGRQEAPTS